MSQLQMQGLAGVARALAAAAAAVLIAACGASVPLTAVLTAPAANVQLEIDKQTDIAGKVVGSGVKAADIYVDGVKYATINIPTGPDTFDIVAPWTPSMPGAHVIQLKGVNDKGEALVTSELVFVTVDAPPPTPAPPTPIPEPTPTPEPTQPPVPTVAAPTEVTGTTGTTATATTTATVTAAATTAPSGAPQVTIANEYANVRTGPGTTYERLGQLNQNQTAPVTGKSEDGLWWQISYSSGPDGKAWVFGELVQFSGDAAQVPVVKVAPPPTAPAQPTAPPQPTAAPTSDVQGSTLLPYSQNMRFEPRDDIGDVPLGYNESKSSSLAWTVNGAKQLDLEITTAQGPGIFSNCPAGNLGSIAAAGFTPGQRVPLSVPSGRFPFTINDKGYYLFTIHVVKADGSTTTIPRNVIVDCFKQ